jgi:hypothetical protein
MTTISLADSLSRLAIFKWAILSLIFLLSCTAFGQNKIEGNVGINYPVSYGGSDQVLYQYWRVGIHTGVTAHLKILEAVNFRPLASYQYFFFQRFEQTLFAGSRAVDSKADGAHVVKFGGELHLEAGEGKGTRFSIFLGGGYAMERPPAMTITWWDFEGSQGIYTSEAPRLNRNYWYGSAGMNLEFSITRDLSIGTSVKYFVNKTQYTGMLATNDTCVMMNCSILYDFLNFGGN